MASTTTSKSRAGSSRSGIRLLQVREKEMADRDLLAAVEEISRLGREDGAAVIVNDRVDVARLAGTGVHLGEEDLPGRGRAAALAGGISDGRLDARFRSGPQRHSRIRTATTWPSARSSKARTKTGRAPRGSEALSRVARMKTKPLVAIGGITADTLDSVFDAGADCAAMIGGLLAGGAARGERAAGARRRAPARARRAGSTWSDSWGAARRRSAAASPSGWACPSWTSTPRSRGLGRDGPGPVRRLRRGGLPRAGGASSCGPRNPCRARVVATGGGCYVREENRRTIARLGTPVFLDVPLRDVALAPRGQDRPAALHRSGAGRGALRPAGAVL